jgi:zona occludens toxin
MAIQLYCGRPGSGKSYGVLENVILPALKINRMVYTNIPLHLEAVEQDFPESVKNIIQFNNDDVTGEWLLTIPGGAIIIIDECWRYWPGGLKANEIDVKVKEFFAEHRHKSGVDNLTQEIVLLTQTPSQIAKVIRDLVDQSVLTVKNSAAGSNKTFNVAVYPGCLTTIESPKDPLVTGLGRYKPEVYKYYKSHTKSETGLPGVEIRADKRGNIWSHWYIRYVAPIVLISALFGAYYLVQFFRGKNSDSLQAAPVQTQPLQISKYQSIPVNQVITPNNANIQPVVPTESLTQRITGVVVIEGRQIIYVKHSEKKHLIKVGMESCKQTLNGILCQLGNEIVTAYTGKQIEEHDQPPTLAQTIVPKVY